MSRPSLTAPGEYRHTQIGYVIIGAAGAAIVATLLVGLAGPRLMVVLVVVGAVLLLFSTLTTRVTGGVLDVYFGFGLIRRRISRNDIRDVRVVHNPWYCGWGIRWIGRGWLWNTSGLRAVELELRNGRRFRIGTDEPEALAEALRRSTR